MSKIQDNQLQNPGGGGSGIENHYADIATLLADQGGQSSGSLQYVADASADPNITSGYAYYEYLGTTVGDLTDYTLFNTATSSIEIVDDLVSTDANKALSANMGRELNDIKPNLGETPTTAYRGDKGKTAFDHSQSAHAPTDAEKNVNADWNSSSGDSQILNKPSLAPSNAEQNVQSDWNETNTGVDEYIKNKPSIAPVAVADCGTAIPMDNILVTYCNMLSANSTTSYSLTGMVLGGYAEVLINAASEPTIGVATKIKGSDFQASTNMLLCIENKNIGGKPSFWLEEL